jgi:hypothetical protein
VAETVAAESADDIARQTVDLQKQRTDHPFDLSGLVLVAPLLTESVELIKKENALTLADRFEHPLEPPRCLSEVAPDQSLVPDNNQRHHRLGGDGLGKRRLSTSRRPDQQDPVSRLHAIGPQ